MTTESTETGASRPRQRSRGVYLLPNLFTTAVLFSGFYAIVAATDGNFDRAGIAVFVAMVCDGLDGRIARWTNTQSDFGVQYDSLSDLISFGLAPALVGEGEVVDFFPKGGVVGGEAVERHSPRGTPASARNTR